MYFNFEPSLITTYYSQSPITSPDFLLAWQPTMEYGFNILRLWGSYTTPLGAHAKSIQIIGVTSHTLSSKHFLTSEKFLR